MFYQDRKQRTYNGVFSAVNVLYGQSWSTHQRRCWGGALKLQSVGVSSVLSKKNSDIPSTSVCLYSVPATQQTNIRARPSSQSRLRITALKASHKSSLSVVNFPRKLLSSKLSLLICARVRSEVSRSSTSFKCTKSEVRIVRRVIVEGMDPRISFQNVPYVGSLRW